MSMTMSNADKSTVEVITGVERRCFRMMGSTGALKRATRRLRNPDKGMSAK